ncbi:hypothetical protein F5Y06DRAFT_85208 [Hypoxylon sp. FL0890]|nr:hypothetical protein F5Y06DRAFT_85208 [Hypoxylon sp. FL0890]
MSCMFFLGLVQKEKEKARYAGPMDCGQHSIYLRLTQHDSPTNCCPRRAISRVQDLNYVRCTETMALDAYFIARNWQAPFTWERAGKITHGHESATLGRNRPLRYRRGRLGSISHPMRRCPIIIGAQALLNCIPIQPGPALKSMMSCLVGGVVSYPGPAYTTYELPMRLTSCATIQFSSQLYGYMGVKTTPPVTLVVQSDLSAGLNGTSIP